MFNRQPLLRFLYLISLGIHAFLFLYLLSKLFPLYDVFFAFLIRVFTPFIIAGLIAYLLHPIVEKLHDNNLPRWLAIICIYVVFLAFSVLLISHLLPVFIHQLKDLNKNLPTVIELYRNTIYRIYENTAYLPEIVHDRLDLILYQLEQFVGDMLSEVVHRLTGIMDVVILVAVIPVLVFYMLKDFQLIKKTLLRFVPANRRDGCKHFLKEVDHSLGDYIRGQLLVCLFVGLAAYGILLLIGMKYPLLLSMVMAVTNIIPYFGPILGAVPAIIIAFTISSKMAVYVLIGVFVVQIIEGNLLSPFIVGKSVNIHPILIIFALVVGGEMGGILGMIIAVPILTVIKVFVIHSKAYSPSD